MFAYLCIKDKLTGSDLLKLLLDNSDDGDHYDKWTCLAKIFDLKVDIPDEYKHMEQLKPEKQNFVTAEIYSDDDSEDMMEILLDFF